MPAETLEPRLDAIDQSLLQAMDALADCRHDLDSHNRIENANAREIHKLKGHIAKLQHDARSSVEHTNPLPSSGI